METWIAKIRINGMAKSFEFKDMSEWNTRKAARQLVSFTQSKGKPAVYLGMEKKAAEMETKVSG